jgi:hypothetical protein
MRYRLRHDGVRRASAAHRRAELGAQGRAASPGADARRQGRLAAGESQVSRHLVVAGALSVLWLAQPQLARAAGPLPDDGERIQTSQYAVDLSHGLVLGGSRPTGLAGAYVAIGEGVDGMLYNPAAPGVRMPYSFDDCDYDLGVGITFPALVKSADFFNSGRRTTDVGVHSQGSEFLFLNVAGLLQWSAWGLGASFDLHNYGLIRSRDPVTGAARDELYARFLTGHLQLARAITDLVVGGGLRVTALSIVRRDTETGVETQLFDTPGTALEAGILWRPVGLPLRLGASAHSAVAADAAVMTGEVVQDAGDRVVPDPDDPTNFDAPNTIYLPDRVTLPWAVSVGAAVQLGARPFNPRWINPTAVLANIRRHLRWRQHERRRRRDAQLRQVRGQGGDVRAARLALDAELETEAALDAEHWQRQKEQLDHDLRRRYDQLARFYVLLSAALLVTGPVDQGVGVESFLQQRVNRSGEQVSLSPRLGVESEAVPHWLRLRTGVYSEPTRFSIATSARRLHATFGADVRLFPWSVFGLFRQGTSWRLSGVIDAAPRYLGWGASVGIWPVGAASWPAPGL